MPTDRWMDKEDMEYVYNTILLSHKKIEIMPFAVTWMDLQIIILSGVRKRKRNSLWYHCKWNLKHNLNYLWSRNRHSQTQKTDLWFPRRGGGGMDWEFGVSKCKLFYIEWINDKALLYSTGNYIHLLSCNKP